MGKALGLIEAVGLTTAVSALDAASKAADVTLIGYEKVIGAGKSVSVTIQLAGEVAAVKAAIDAGELAGNKVGNVISSHVIPRPHEEVDRLIEEFKKNNKKEKETKTKQTKKTQSKKSQSKSTTKKTTSKESSK